MELKKTTKIEGILPLFLYLFFAICWIVNIIKFFNCDFRATYSDEVVHAVGVIVPPASMLTVWF